MSDKRLIFSVGIVRHPDHGPAVEPQISIWAPGGRDIAEAQSAWMRGRYPADDGWSEPVVYLFETPPEVDAAIAEAERLRSAGDPPTVVGDQP